MFRSCSRLPLVSIVVLGILARSAVAFVSRPTTAGSTRSDRLARGMLPNSLQGVIFDIDGTLADSWKLGFDATQSVLTQNNIDPITEEEYHRCTRYCTPDRLARHAGLEPGDAEFEAVGERLGHEFDTLYIGLVSLETAAFFPGIHAFLENLPSHLKLGALTNAAVAYAHAVFQVNLKNSERSVKFESVHGADDVPAPKPAADGLWLVCQELGVKPEDCVYVGDSPSDAMAAKNAGMPAIGVLWGSHSEQSLQKAPFDHLCRTVEELKEILPGSVPAAAAVVQE
ncbi:Phosphoglycolate phosphatase [Seminavis robusta]|uniref:Phosphoglycolate phosphatase n=1 Tax=Seminavis robusta TaxID=568900 RepID=A0A9N8HBP8_9STRA|nr:Phosphoglycolate phosphatase [Seminavis robusta]|eukprot:Sro373_g128930.1 Phosphoglycolate phosphatase (284) ;mRNA; f:5019-5870